MDEYSTMILIAIKNAVQLTSPTLFIPLVTIGLGATIVIGRF